MNLQGVFYPFYSPTVLQQKLKALAGVEMDAESISISLTHRTLEGKNLATLVNAVVLKWHWSLIMKSAWSLNVKEFF